MTRLQRITTGFRLETRLAPRHRSDTLGWSQCKVGLSGKVNTINRAPIAFAMALQDAYDV